MSAVDRFVACALAAVGGRYCTPPNEPRCTDCSGLVKRCYREATGRDISGSSYEQAKMGKPVKAVRPGDILVYGGGAHVGIAVAPNRAVHALNPDLGVKETRIEGANLGLNYSGARRLDFGPEADTDDGVPAQDRPLVDEVEPAAGDVPRQAAALAGTVSLTTPFRTIPALPLATWRKEFADRQSPVTQAEVDDCFAACGGLAIALDQAIGETSLKDADAIRDKNLLRLTEADGSTFRTYSAHWKPFAEYVRRVFDPGYKGGVYYPKQAAALTYADGGRSDGYNLSLAGYKTVYIGGRGCLDSRGQTCANGERYDPNRPMTGASVVTDPNAPSINRSIAASMLRYERWFGAPAPQPGPEPVPGEIVFGRVPRPVGMQVRIIGNNTAWDDLGPRVPRGITIHRMLGTLNGTDSFFRGEARNRALTDFVLGRGSLGPVYQWNDLTGRRAPWASGPADGVKEDGRPFVDRYGVNAINRDCASIEIEGFQNDPVPTESWRALVELVAWLADAWLRVDYQTWPRNRDGVHALLHHREFTAQKECPFAWVIANTGRLIEDVRERLREYQTGATA